MTDIEATAADVMRQLEHGRIHVPDHVWGGIVGHVLDGIPTGNFLTGLFENDLLKAACGADEVCLARIADLARFMHNDAPQACWGSAEKVALWRKLGGIRGGAHLADEGGKSLVHALQAAVCALRSYQHGNTATALAADIADAGEAALRAGGHQVLG